MRLPGPLLEARFIQRPNRFLTVVELSGERVEAHLPDPGRLKELLLPETRVWVRPANDPRRKTSYTLALAEAPNGEIVSLITTLSNDLAEEALREPRIFELSDWTIEKREHRHGASRFDFLLARGDSRLLLEVKSVTLVENGTALFPDAVTARGARHVTELAVARDEGFESAVLFVVQRRAERVTAARSIDPKFADALERANEKGVKLLAYRSRVTLENATLTDPIPVGID